MMLKWLIAALIIYGGFVALLYLAQRLASAMISSERLFSRLDGLSGNARRDPGPKISALQPFPTGLTFMRYPLYSTIVMA